MDAYAALPHRTGHASHQLRRVDAGAVGVEVPGHRAGDPDPLGDLGRRQLAVEALGLRLRPGDVQHPAQPDVGVDALTPGDGDHLVHRAADRGTHRLQARSPAAAAYARGLPGSSLESQPPLRPEAPNPANSASTRRMSSVGSAAWR